MEQVIMKYFKKGDLVEITDIGCNYSEFPKSKLVKWHSKYGENGQTFRVLDINKDYHFPKYLGFLNNEYVCIDSSGLKLIEETYEIF